MEYRVMSLPYIPFLSELSQEVGVSEHGGVQFPPRANPPSTHFAQRQEEYNSIVMSMQQA
jgi:hypothetical protein